jgi:L-ascorbate oxidase
MVTWPMLASLVVKLRAAASLALILGFMSAAAAAAPLLEPPVLSSSKGVLDLLMVARAAKVPTLTPFDPTGWVYDICLRPTDGRLSCPATSADLYGGTRLQLQQGDHLKIRLVNKLPPITDSYHATEEGHAYLALNPVNIHTHGLLVSTHFPTVDNPTYGDNVFVMTMNPANGPLPADSMTHGDVRIGYTDYDIAIPKTHPSGLFWFHPHVHGIAANQMTAGMAGIITIGDVGDYVCKNAACSKDLDKIAVRHMILKDSQILSDGTLLDQSDFAFCASVRAAGEPARRGSCAGANNGRAGDYTGGRWFFPLNGQPYPTMKMTSAFGEIWRITSASASTSFDLHLTNAKQKRDMLFQVLAIDGIAVDTNSGATPSEITAESGAKIKAVPCPSSVAPGTKTAQAICTRSILMMPSSRVELWVVDRNKQDKVVKPAAGDQAVFRTVGASVGQGGSKSPAVDLGLVQFGGGGNASKGPQTLAVTGEVAALADPQRLAADFEKANAKIGAAPNCTPLPAGHRRRVFFNSAGNGYGLGYEEIDAKGKTLPGTFRDVAAFDPATPTVCVPLGKGNTAVHEQWQLVNLMSINHNFHIHQTRFALIGGDSIPPQSVPPGGILVDNVPLPHADGQVCRSVADWRKGVCKTHPVTVDIPFAIAGDFVYHCHILQHEDAGMMARIRVRASP